MSSKCSWAPTHIPSSGYRGNPDKDISSLLFRGKGPVLPIKLASITLGALLPWWGGGQVMVWAGQGDKGDGGGTELMPHKMMCSVKRAQKREV